MLFLKKKNKGIERRPDGNIDLMANVFLRTNGIQYGYMNEVRRSQECECKVASAKGSGEKPYANKHTHTQRETSTDGRRHTQTHTRRARPTRHGAISGKGKWIEIYKVVNFQPYDHRWRGAPQPLRSISFENEPGRILNAKRRAVIEVHAKCFWQMLPCTLYNMFAFDLFKTQW